MASSPLTVDGLIGRQIKLLGRVQQVVNANSTVATIFKTGDSDYPYQSTFVAFVGIVTTDGLALTSTLTIGSSGSSDWTGASVSLVAVASPVVLYCNLGGAPALSLPVYAQGAPFQASISVGAGGSQLLEFSAYGWAY